MSARAIFGAAIPAQGGEQDEQQIELWRRQSQLFAAIQDAVLVTNLAGVVVDCNPAAIALFGYPRSTLLGQLPGAQRDSAKAAKHFQTALEAVRRDGEWTGDLPLVRGDGVHLVSCTKVVGLYDDGQLVGTAGIHRDVTEERFTAARLGAAEQRWRLTLDGAPSGIALIGLDGRFERVNVALCATLGYSEEALLALTAQDVTHPDDLDLGVHLASRLLVGEIDSYTVEKRYLHAQGHSVLVSLSVGVVCDPLTGEPLHFVSQVQDVTARRRSESRLAAIIASAIEPFVGIDATGFVTEWNTAAEAAFGWSRSDALGQPLHELIIPRDKRQAHLDGLARLRAGAASRMLGVPTELMACSRDGRYFPVELTTWRADETAGELYAFVRDISVRIRAQHEGRLAAQRQAALVEAQLAIADVELTPTKVMQHICDFAQRLTEADHAVIEMRTSAEFMTCSAGTAGMTQHLGLQVPVNGSLTGLGVKTGQALTCDDCETDPRVDAEACRRVGVRSMVVVPLRREGAVVGVLEVLSSTQRQFSHADQVTLELLAAPFGAAISNANRLETASRQALTDPLTGLANRAEALHELDRAFNRQKRNGGHVAVAFVDLDGFKAINDTLGHPAGDQTLISVAERLRAAVRTTDTPARYGGDEFLIICEGMNQPPDVAVLAQRLVESLPGEYHLGQGTALVGASVGIALTQRPVPAEQLLRAADEAMYEAKRAGGNRYTTRILPTDDGDGLNAAV